uniref:Uncharacterized protein n=1 Tax=Trichobilharzia regenti TaxID=157069 RepID=A0AA85J123_TRIRE|nr:unnamed protein product [Trichobilharzia regenti]
MRILFLMLSECRRFPNWFQVDEGISCLSDSDWLALTPWSLSSAVETMLLGQINERDNLCQISPIDGDWCWLLLLLIGRLSSSPPSLLCSLGVLFSLLLRPACWFSLASLRVCVTLDKYHPHT